MIRYRTGESKVFSVPGNRYRTQYKMKILKDGKHEFVEVGKVDTYAEIQSHFRECDLHFIVERCTQDPSYMTEALNARIGSYVDLTKMPKTLAEALQITIDAKKYFAHLPNGLRAKFGNDVNQFIAQIGTNEFDKIFSDFEKSIAPKTDTAASSAASSNEVINNA